MTIKIYKRVVHISVLLFLLSSFKCNKDSSRPCYMVTPYSFSVTSKWTPQQEVYHIGDTLYLTSAFPKMLIDQINPAIKVDYSNSTGVGGSYAFYELDTIQHDVKGAVLKFEIIPIKGSVGNGIIVPNEQKTVNYLETGINYAFSIKVVLKVNGIFAFYISDLKSNGLKGKNCTNAGFSNTLTNSSKNINLFEYAMGRPPASQFEIERIYCFRVQK